MLATHVLFCKQHTLQAEDAVSASRPKTSGQKPCNVNCMVQQLWNFLFYRYNAEMTDKTGRLVTRYRCLIFSAKPAAKILDDNLFELGYLSCAYFRNPTAVTGDACDVDYDILNYLLNDFFPLIMIASKKRTLIGPLIFSTETL